MLHYFLRLAWTESHSAQFVFVNLSFILMLFAIVVLHELGPPWPPRSSASNEGHHPLADWRLAGRAPAPSRSRVVIAIAGPAVNVVLARLLLLAGWPPRHATLGDANPVGQGHRQPFVLGQRHAVGFNLIGVPMDSGRVLRALLALGMDHARATQIAAGVGQALALVFALVGLFGIPGLLAPNFMLIFIALFVYMGATQEANLALTRLNLSGASVRQAMISRFQTLVPRDTLGWALQQAMTGAQKDFPVVENGRLLGVLGRHELLQGLHEHGANAFVGEAMSCPPRSLRTPPSPTWMAASGRALTWLPV